jgi:hypothetical protein
VRWRAVHLLAVPRNLVKLLMDGLDLGSEPFHRFLVYSVLFVKHRVAALEMVSSPPSSKLMRSLFRSRGDMCFFPVAFSTSFGTFFYLAISTIAAWAISFSI